MPIATLISFCSPSSAHPQWLAVGTPFILCRSTVDVESQGVDGGFTLWKLHCWARTYWHRLAGTALSWFVWDFAFYGNKLFQGTFIAIINPGATLVQASKPSLLQSSSATTG